MEYRYKFFYFFKARKFYLARFVKKYWRVLPNENEIDEFN
jgi:hypothetical protein